MQRKLTAFAAVFIIIITVYTAFVKPVRASEGVAEKVYRLHIIANSDCESDQALKLKVRDEILKQTAVLYKNCRNVNDAKCITEEHASELQATAEEALRANGCNDDVYVYTDKHFFETRHYENYTLPAGEYECLKIIIGEGRGHNWWCVLFPSVCLNACSSDFDGVLTPEEQRLIASGKYVAKFKIIEIYERIKNYDD